MNHIKTNPHHHNLGKIPDSLWKHKITITTSLKSNHANVFGVHKLCGCFAKTILRHQKQYDNEPLGFISFEFTKSDNLHFHSIWTQLNGVDELNEIFAKSNVHQPLYSGDNVMSGWGYRVIDRQICDYIQKTKYDGDWILYITKNPDVYVYYTPSLMKSIEGANRAIDKINKQSGLVDDRNIHLFRYLSEVRKSRHNDSLFERLESGVMI